jgi:hypothetical protein
MLPGFLCSIRSRVRRRGALFADPKFDPRAN